MHGTDETPNLLGERELPCSQEGIGRSLPTHDHIAAGLEELRLSGVWLDASVMKLMCDALDALTQIPGIAPERCAMDAILES